MWTTSEPTEDEPSEIETNTNKKRKKNNDSGRKLKTRNVSLEGHVGAVNAVTFDNSDSNIVYTGGWDHSIRSWDVEQQVNLTTKNCEKVVLDVDYSPHSKLLATGHSDNTIRLWDPRSEGNTKKSHFTCIFVYIKLLFFRWYKCKDESSWSYRLGFFCLLVKKF